MPSYLLGHLDLRVYQTIQSPAEAYEIIHQLFSREELVDSYSDLVTQKSFDGEKNYNWHWILAQLVVRASEAQHEGQTAYYGEHPLYSGWPKGLSWDIVHEVGSLKRDPK